MLNLDMRWAFIGFEALVGAGAIAFGIWLGLAIWHAGKEF